MASPPSSFNLPKKRPSLSGSLPPNPSKRRKPSTGPSGLRQTSFPPEESDQRAQFSRSPSVDSTFTANTNTTRKKGRKGKGDDDVRSTTGTSVRGGKAGTAAGSEAAEKADDEEEAEQDDGGEALDAVLEGQGEADEKQEKEHLRMLVDRLDPDQSDRYAKYRAVKLKKETVRKITNQTLSQSVPQSVVTTINSYTKVFIGSLIERARTVQQEWQAVAEYAPIDDPRVIAAQQPPAQQQQPSTPQPQQQQQQQQQQPPPSHHTPQNPGGYHNPYGYQHLHPAYNPQNNGNPYSNIRIPGPPNSASPTPGPSGASASPPPAHAPNGTAAPAAGPANTQTPTPTASQDTSATAQPPPPSSSGGTTVADCSPPPKTIPADTPLRERLAERDRGPLTPDHLREALRRYKRDREGGAMGFLGLSLEGRERTAGRMAGRRLFR